MRGTPCEPDIVCDILCVANHNNVSLCPQMTQIQEQQKAIHNLKASLMDDLSERGILSTPECERILDIHKQVTTSFTTFIVDGSV